MKRNLNGVLLGLMIMTMHSVPVFAHRDPGEEQRQRNLQGLVILLGTLSTVAASIDWVSTVGSGTYVECVVPYQGLGGDFDRTIPRWGFGGSLGGRKDDRAVEMVYHYTRLTETPIRRTTHLLAWTKKYFIPRDPGEIYEVYVLNSSILAGLTEQDRSDHKDAWLGFGANLGLGLTSHLPVNLSLDVSVSYRGILFIATQKERKRSPFIISPLGDMEFEHGMGFLAGLKWAFLNP